VDSTAAHAGYRIDDVCQTGSPEQAGPYQTLVIRAQQSWMGPGRRRLAGGYFCARQSNYARRADGRITREEEKTDAAGAKHAAPDE